MLTRQLSTGNGERDLSAVYIDVERVTSLSMPMIEMSKWVVSVGRPVARHDFSPSQTRHDPVVDGLGPARPVSQARLGLLLWHAVPARFFYFIFQCIYLYIRSNFNSLDTK
jgi:hypothetical protein